MAEITHGGSLPDSANKSDFYALIDNASISGIDTNDLAADAGIKDTQLAQITAALKVDGSSFTGLANIHPAAGIIPAANLPASSSPLTDGSQGFTNLLTNGNFESWVGGTTVAPDNWVSTGTGTVARESSTIKLGTYSAKLGNTASNSVDIEQSIHTNKGIAYFKGRVITLSAWVNASAAIRVRISINDGITTSSSSYHTGGGTWELLTVTMTISASATQVLTALTIATGTAIFAFFDGAMVLEGSSIVAFSPSISDSQVGLGSWVSKLSPTVYQALTDGFAVGFLVLNTDPESGSITFYTDSSASPTTQRGAASAYRSLSGASIPSCSFCIPVKKGDYYYFGKSSTGSGTGTFFFIPMGS